MQPGNAAAPTTSRAVVETTVFRPEIQALRAIAVLSVVLFHLWPNQLPGGYVGVDVFFVISGYLITAHLLREVIRTGSVKLATFWSRRARRLLPASLLVLLVSAALTFLVIPEQHWRSFFWEILSSAFYFENWTLAANAVDYLAADNVATLAQHFWSLSVEEQFYLVWPLLILGSVFLASRGKRQRNRRLAVGITLAIVTVASLAFSIYLTEVDPNPAYFATPTRAWEFGIGGLLAVAGTRILHGHRALRAAVSWAGIAVIAATTVVFTGSTPFPGSAALVPVLATAAVLWAGSPRGWYAPSALYALRPVQFLGDVSYSLYLWHWPVIVAASFMLPNPATILQNVVLLAIALALAWLTKRYLEDPLRSRTSFLAKRRPAATLVASLAAMSLVLVVAGSGLVVIQQRVVAATAAAEAAAAAPQVCFGAAAMDPDNTACDNSSLDGAITPDTSALEQDKGDGFACAAGREREIEVCHFGSDDPDAVQVALTGDSHAVMMMPALLEEIDELGWSLDTHIAGGCVWGNMGDDPVCDNRRDLQDTFESDEYDVVILAATRYVDERLYSEFPATKADPRVAGFVEAFEPVVERGGEVVVIADNPSFEQESIDCLAASRTVDEAELCSVSRSEGYRLSDAAAKAAQKTEGVSLVDLNRFYCSPTECPLVIGNVAAYYDPTHITATFSRTLGPYLREQLIDLLPERYTTR